MVFVSFTLKPQVNSCCGLCGGCGTVNFQVKSGAMVALPVLCLGCGNVTGKSCGLFNQVFYL